MFSVTKSFGYWVWHILLPPLTEPCIEIVAHAGSCLVGAVNPKSEAAKSLYQDGYIRPNDIIQCEGATNHKQLKRIISNQSKQRVALELTIRRPKKPLPNASTSTVAPVSSSASAGASAEAGASAMVEAKARAWAGMPPSSVEESPACYPAGYRAPLRPPLEQSRRGVFSSASSSPLLKSRVSTLRGSGVVTEILPGGGGGGSKGRAGERRIRVKLDECGEEIEALEAECPPLQGRGYQSKIASFAAGLKAAKASHAPIGFDPALRGPRGHYQSAPPSRQLPSSKTLASSFASAVGSEEPYGAS
mmetsp:Transcript_2597/g.5693  ORF Transcript_2597/g.5693 Transcript_2597/m.5693 type:complete len:304 (-) Transcript_2597:87-998(-)